MCALVAATTLTVVVIADEGPETCCSGSGAVAGSRPSPTARASASRAAGPPMCVIGQWRTVDEAFMIKFYTDQPELPFSSSGRVFELRPDGTGTERHENVVYTGSFRGNQLRIVGNGTIDFTWTATDRTITYVAQTKATITYSYFDQRGLLSTQPLTPNPNLNEVDDYTCAGPQLIENNTNRGYRSVWTRTAGFGVYG